MEIVKFDFSTDELWFLMSQFAPAYVVGMENPYLGWVSEEITEANSKAVQLLVERDLARIVSEDSLEVDDAMMSMVRTCVQPEHTLIIQGQAETGEEHQRYIHFADGWIVEHLQLAPGHHSLAVFENCEGLQEYLAWDLRLGSQTASQGADFFLPEEMLFAASKCYAEGSRTDGYQTLQEAKLDEELLNRLDSTLSTPVANTSFTFLINMKEADTQYVSGFGFLEGPSEFWILQPGERGGANAVEFHPASSALVQQRFRDMLPV